VYEPPDNLGQQGYAGGLFQERGFEELPRHVVEIIPINVEDERNAAP
jgi:hypothetical protein